MLFTYTYRATDGQRHSAEIEAPSRDEAFAVIRRELGVNPIKVVAVNPGAEAERRRKSRSVGRAFPPAATIALIAVVVGAAWWMATRRGGAPYGGGGNAAPMPILAPEPVGAPVSARPRPRMQIDGFENINLDKVFLRRSERFLAKYAMPGVRMDGGEKFDDGLVEDLIASIKAPIPVADEDGESIRKLKGVVAGIKSDIMLLLASGQSINEVLVWLENRQKMEAAYREKIVAGFRVRPSSKDEVNRLLRTLGLKEVE